jgi:SRSO17 transposase
VKRKYIENLGKIEDGIVAVTVYGLVEGMTFPLIFEVYKPKKRLREGEPYLSKPKIAVEIIRYLREIGLRFKLVLADSLYGESHTTFINVLNKLQLNYAVAIRSNHEVWLPKDQRVRENKW